MSKSFLCSIHSTTELKVASILDPDFSLSSFPRRAYFTRGYIKAMPPSKRRPMVRFDLNLNEEFVIQHRRSQNHSVSTEELLNRTLRVRREIRNTLDEMEHLNRDECYLQNQVHTLRGDRGICGMLRAKRLQSALVSRSKHLGREIQEMRIKRLRIKGKSNQLQHLLSSVLNTNATTGRVPRRTHPCNSSEARLPLRTVHQMSELYTVRYPV